MNTSEIYQPIFEALNRVIFDFNEFLIPSARFKKLSATDSSMFADVANLRWEDQHWPSKDSYGVYLLCGSNPDHSRFAAYVGKASHGVIGSRLWSHLHPQRKNNHFIIENYENERFPLHAIITMPVSEGAPPGFASALEEFILEYGIDGVELVNAIGNKRS